MDKEPVPSVQKRVLVVDNDPSLCDFIEQAFRNLVPNGYLVVSACNGQEALDKIEEENFQPDLIVLDLLMPVMTGQEFARRVREIDPRWSKHIMIMTAARLSPTQRRELGDLSRIILEKPFELEDFLKGVNLIMSPCCPNDH